QATAYTRSASGTTCVATLTNNPATGDVVLVTGFSAVTSGANVPTAAQDGAGTPNAYTFVKGNSGEFANAGSFGTFIYVAGATANKAVTVTFPTGGASSCFVDD